MLNALEKDNPTIHLEVEVACAVSKNINVSDLDPSAIDAICNGMIHVLLEHKGETWPNLREMAYQADNLVNVNQEYSCFSWECWQEAYDLAKAQ